jgi:replicative DNA helicase
MSNFDNGSGDAQNLSPRSVEAEEAVLGSILINPDVLLEIAAFLQPQDFFVLRNAWVYAAILALHERSEAVDNLTVVNELRLQKRLDDIGGASYITFLINNTPTHIHAETYGRIVERSSIRRRLLSAATKIGQVALDEGAEIVEVIDKAESELFAVTEKRMRRDMISISTAASEYFDRVEYLYKNPDESLGVPTGFTDLDKLLGGMQKSDLIIVAARPGMGKTSFMLSVALNAARQGRARIGVYSMEMSNEQLVQRLISAETSINSQRLRLGSLDDREWTLFTEATGKLGNLMIFMDDTPAISVPQMRTKSRRLYREYGLDLVIVDYLQLMSGGTGKNDNRVQEISTISRGLKELARELNVPVVAAAQLSRAVEQRQDKRPQLSDLRESGSIEQDADIVMFIYRDDMYNENSDRPNQADIIVAKHRNGPTGVVTLFFRKEVTQFTNMQKSNINLSDF